MTSCDSGFGASTKVTVFNLPFRHQYSLLTILLSDIASIPIHLIFPSTSIHYKRGADRTFLTVKYAPICRLSCIVKLSGGIFFFSATFCHTQHTRILPSVDLAAHWNITDASYALSILSQYRKNGQSTDIASMKMHLVQIQTLSHIKTE